MQVLARFIYFKLLKWNLAGSFPDIDKCVVVVATHTSWWDFVLGLLVRKVIGVDVHYIAKDSLFKPPFGWYFRWMGGSPVNRGKSTNSVRAIARLFTTRQFFRLALAPEGTRKKVVKWKTGFYYIALAANVPIVLVAFDYGRKTVRISGPRLPTGDISSDFEDYHSFYKGVKGKVPEYGF
jgi:1-acyl-sn-glycerol-3-phosphate acyltransferase